MLYQRTPSTIVKQREPYVLGCILGTASLVTILPALTGHIGHRHSFYSCWVEGPYYYLFYGKLSVVMLLSMRWCLLTMNRLSEISTSLVGMDRPAALRSLAVYRAGNVCLAGGAAFVLTVILLYDFFPDSPLVCVLTSADILLFPFIYAVFVHGYTCSEAMHRCCDSTRSRLGWEEEEEEEGHESSLAATTSATAADAHLYNADDSGCSSFSVGSSIVSNSRHAEFHSGLGLGDSILSQSLISATDSDHESSFAAE